MCGALDFEVVAEEVEDGADRGRRDVCAARDEGAEICGCCNAQNVRPILVECDLRAEAGELVGAVCGRLGEVEEEELRVSAAVGGEDGVCELREEGLE